MSYHTILTYLPRRSPSAAGGGFLASFFLPSKEQKRAKAEFEKWQKDFKQKAGEDVSHSSAFQKQLVLKLHCLSIRCPCLLNTFHLRGPV